MGIIPSSITSLNSNQAATSTSIASTQYVQNSRNNKRKADHSGLDDNENNFFSEAIGNISLAELTRTLSDERCSLYEFKKERLAAPKKRNWRTRCVASHKKNIDR